MWKWKKTNVFYKTTLLNSIAKCNLKNFTDYHLLSNTYCFAIHEQKVDKPQGLRSHLCLWLQSSILITLSQWW